MGKALDRGRGGRRRASRRLPFVPPSAPRVCGKTRAEWAKRSIVVEEGGDARADACRSCRRAHRGSAAKRALNGQSARSWSRRAETREPTPAVRAAERTEGLRQ